MKLRYGVFFRKPADPAKYPTYIGVTKPVDLQTMRFRLHTSAYPSVEALMTDFDEMEQNSKAWHGADHLHTNHAHNLKVAFEKYMIEYPGPGEDFVPRKKAKMTGPNTLHDQMPAPSRASPCPRAAKTAMQDRVYGATIVWDEGFCMPRSRNGGPRRSY